MENISASITLQDNVTGPMINMINMIDLSIVSIEQLQNVVNNSIDMTVYENVENQLTQTTAAAQELDGALQNIAQPEVDVRDEKITKAIDKTDCFTKSVKALRNKFANMDTVSTILGLADQMATASAQLDRMNDGMRTTEELQDMIFASAERARGSYQATAETVAEMGLLAGGAFSDNGETVAFVEQVNKQFALAGMETSEAQSAMHQLTQAMKDGVLSGEELNSVFGQAPNAVQSIAGYIEGNGDVLSAVASAMGMTTAELAGNVQGNMAQIADKGLITAELVKAAMLSSADETNAKFANMPGTFGQIWTSFQNYALRAFQPILGRINELTNSEIFQGFVNGAVTGLAIISRAAQEIFNLFASGAQFMADNWSWISPIIYGVAGALAVYYGWQLLCAIAAGVMAVAQAVLEAVMGANPIILVVIAIIALIAIFYAAVAAINHFAGTSASATGIIAGAFMLLVAHIVNGFVAPIWNILAALANFIGNVCNDPIAAIKIAFYDMCLTVVGYILNLANSIETLLNKIPGVTIDITSGLDDFYSNLEQAQQAVKDESGWVEYVGKMEYMDYNDAWNAGYSFGEGLDETIANFDPSSLFDFDIPSADDYGDLANNAAGVEEIGSGVEDIAGDTGAIVDSVETSEEELKYLRDIAEQEAINRYTTSEIRIEQTNYNNISSTMDLDGIVSGLDYAVGEAIDNMTEGVHVE